MTEDKPEAFVPLRAGTIQVNLGRNRENNCTTCRHWHHEEGARQAFGECRRYAPRPTQPRYEGANAGVLAPKTSGVYWCGEWERNAG